MTKLFNRLIFFPMLALYCAITTDPNIILSSKANYKWWIIFIAQTKKKIFRF